MSSPSDPKSKILTYAAVDAWIAAERSQGHRIAFTCGSFDLLHPGHVQYLARARTLCDRLLVAVNTDDSIRQYKSPLRPINPQEHRMYLVAGLESVDVVTTLEEVRPLSLIRRWKPDVYVKGGDYKVESLRSGDAVREYGGTVQVIKPEFDTSSTQVIERIALLAAHAPPERLEGGTSTGLVLLDRDGTLIRDVPFLHSPASVDLMPGAVEAVRRLQDAGLRLAIVTNQQGIGLGYYGIQEFIAVNQEILRRLGPDGIRISRIYFCPHSVADACACRKPQAGMITRAMREFGVPPDRTFMIGDTDADIEAGKAAGCRTFRVGPAQGLATAAEWVLESLERALDDTSNTGPIDPGS